MLLLISMKYGYTTYVDLISGGQGEQCEKLFEKKFNFQVA